MWEILILWKTLSGNYLGNSRGFVEKLIENFLLVYLEIMTPAWPGLDFVRIMVGIFGLGSLAWDRPLGSFAWVCSASAARHSSWKCLLRDSDEMFAFKNFFGNLSSINNHVLLSCFTWDP